MAVALGENGAFVLGSGRCGSTMVSDILNLHDEILSISEFLSVQGNRSLLPGVLDGAAYWARLSSQTPVMARMFNARTAPREYLYPHGRGRFPPGRTPPILATTLPHLSADPDALFDQLEPLVRAQPAQRVQAHHADLFAHLMRIRGGRVWVERSGLSLMFARVLPRLFPGAKIVALFRDGRDVALSLRAYQPVRPMIWNWIYVRRLGHNPISLTHPAGRSRRQARNERIFGPLAPIGHMLAKPPPLKHCAAFWSAMTLNAVRELQALPEDRRLYLRYDRLTTEPEVEIRRLTAFLGVDAAPDFLAAAMRIPQARPARWSSLPVEDQRDLSDWTAEARAAVDRLF